MNLFFFGNLSLANYLILKQTNQLLMGLLRLRIIIKPSLKNNK